MGVVPNGIVPRCSLHLVASVAARDRNACAHAVLKFMFDPGGSRENPQIFFYLSPVRGKLGGASNGVDFF